MERTWSRRMAEGQFDVSGLSAGSYMVTAFDPTSFAEAGQGGMQFTPRVVDIAEGQVSDVDVGGGSVAGGASPVTGTVSGAEGTTTRVLGAAPSGRTVDGEHQYHEHRRYD